MEAGAVAAGSASNINAAALDTEVRTLPARGASPSGPASSARGERGESLEPFGGAGLQVHSVYRDTQVNIVSDESMTAAQAQVVARKVEAAYAYDGRSQRWANPAPLGGQLEVAVLSKRSFGQLTGNQSGVGGFTTGPNLFVVPDSVVGAKTALSEDVIAHELGHVQDFREGGSRLGQIPIYLQEGKEYVLGESYPLQEGIPNPHLAYVRNSLAQLTPDQARDVLASFRTPQDEAGSGPAGFQGETTGALYVEFLRTRLGGGKADAVPRLANVVSQVGQGTSYAQAFHAAFGCTPKAAEDAFVSYIAATQGNPTQRFAGTIFGR